MSSDVTVSRWVELAFARAHGEPAATAEARSTSSSHGPDVTAVTAARERMADLQRRTKIAKIGIAASEVDAIG
jgi:hypothetical protein